jgi:glycosyltransferase involved in cell wall biosynthesis
MLCGGVKVVFDQAKALTALGHDVSILAKTGDHNWYPYPINIKYQPAFDMGFSVPPDVLICTYWTTVTPALRMNIPLTFHLCQGFEGSFAELEHLHTAIDEAYRIPIVKLVIGEWIEKVLLKTFGDNAFKIFTIGQVVDVDLFKPGNQDRRTVELRRPNVLVVGDYRVSCKGVADALQAVAMLRRNGVKLHLVRVSTDRLTEAEHRITPVDESLISITPAEMATVYQNTDVFIAPNLSNEGFGLPLAEALACAIPSVATRIPSFLSFDTKKDYACFVPERDPSAIAEGVMAILQNDTLRRTLVKRGPGLIHARFSALGVAHRILMAIQQVKWNHG